MREKFRIRFDSQSDNRKSKTCPESYRRIENPKWLGLSVFAFVLVVAGPVAEAQQPGKIPDRIPSPCLPSTLSPRIETFHQGLRELGYVEGKNIIIEYRSAEGKLERVPALAAELVRLKVDIIVTPGAPVSRAAKEATVTIPIVMTQIGDPVGSGFVASPGGNITGLSTLAPELSGKQLELLKEIVPKLSRVAVFGTSTYPGNAESLKEVEFAAGTLKVKPQYLDVLGPKDIETAFRAASKALAEAVLMMVPGAIAGGHRTEIAELAVKSWLPAIYNRRELAGGLISYGVNVNDLDRRAAVYVDKILKAPSPPIFLWNSRRNLSW
jgi:putative ABC transport system substrate-binding protein